MIPRYALTICLSLLFFSQPLLAKDFQLLLLQQKIMQLIKGTDINSTILLAEDETFTTELADGYITPDQKSNLRLYNQFMIGSLSKQFTAAALLHALNNKNHSPENDSEAQESIQASLDRPISVYLPNAHSIWHGKMPEWANEITLHQLLTHTSGLSNYTEQDAFTKKNTQGIPFFAETHKPYQLIQLIKNAPPLFTPGSSYAYSNTNYLLIAEIIESITRRTYKQYIEENFLIPLQMQDSFVAEEGNHQVIRENNPKLVEPIFYDPTQKQNTFRSLHWLIDLSNTKGSGNLISTVRDLEKWNTALHTTSKVLPKPLYDLMVTPYADNDSEGYGLSMESTQFGMLYSYQGRIDGFNSGLLFLPDRNISIIVLSNLEKDPDVEASKKQKVYLKGFDSIWQLIDSSLYLSQ